MTWSQGQAGASSHTPLYPGVVEAWEARLGVPRWHFRYLHARFLSGPCPCQPSSASWSWCQGLVVHQSW